MDNNELKGHILIVDDEESICEILQYNLEKEGYGVTCFNSAEETLDFLKANSADLILLDIMLGGINGLNLSKVLREDFKSSIPIIFISALDTEPDILKGFSCGADDYISKPFSVKEVIARVGAVVHRYKNRIRTSTDQNELSEWHNGKSDNAVKERETRDTFGPMRLDYQKRRIYINDSEVLLTQKEWKILSLLTGKYGEILSRQEILSKVWGANELVTERTVDVHIARLRKKMGIVSDYIVNRSGYGYIFTENGEKNSR